MLGEVAQVDTNRQALGAEAQDQVVPVDGDRALQRGLLPKSGPWAATLVRFLFGLPFALAFAAVAGLVTPGARAHLTAPFWIGALTGSVSQVVATACLLVSMRRAGFAVGTSVQQSALPLAAILGLFVFHDHLRAIAWAAGASA